jgi:hypothetical protein
MGRWSGIDPWQGQQICLLSKVLRLPLGSTHYLFSGYHSSFQAVAFCTCQINEWMNEFLFTLTSLRLPLCNHIIVPYETQSIQIGSNDIRARRCRLFPAVPKCGSSDRWQCKQRTTVKYFEQLTDVISGFRHYRFHLSHLRRTVHNVHLHHTCSKKVIFSKTNIKQCTPRPYFTPCCFYVP